MTQWISVKERLPTINDCEVPPITNIYPTRLCHKFLCFVKHLGGKSQIFVEFDFTNNEWSTKELDGESYIEVLFWMPIQNP